MSLGSITSSLRRFGFPPRLLRQCKFLWRPSDGLTPTIGPAITLDRDSEITGKYNGKIIRFPDNDQLPIDHGIYGAYTIYPGYRTKIDAWTQNLTTATAKSGSILQGENYYELACDASNGYHYCYRLETYTTDVTIHTFGVLVRKRGNLDYCRLVSEFENVGQAYGTFQFSAGTWSSAWAGASYVSGSANAQQLDDDWWLLSWSQNVTSAGTFAKLFFSIVDSDGATLTFTRPESDWGYDVAAAWYTKSKYKLSPIVGTTSSAYAVDDADASVTLGSNFTGPGFLLAAIRSNHAAADSRETEETLVALASSSTAKYMALSRNRATNALGLKWDVTAGTSAWRSANSTIDSAIEEGQPVAVLGVFGDTYKYIGLKTDDGYLFNTSTPSGDEPAAADALNRLRLGSVAAGSSYLEGDLLLAAYGEFGEARLSKSDFRNLLDAALRAAREYPT